MRLLRFAQIPVRAIQNPPNEKLGEKIIVAKERAALAVKAMKNKNRTDSRSENVIEEPVSKPDDDEDTCKMPVLDLDPFSADHSSPHIDTQEEPTGDRATKWLSYLESKVEHLQSRWTHIDSELTARDERIHELQLETQSKESDAEELRADLKQAERERQNLSDELAHKNARIDEMSAEEQERAEEFEAQDNALRSLEERRTELQTQLDGNLQENERLHRLIEDEKCISHQLNERTEHLSATKESLLGNVQDLELYIEGQKVHWSEMNAELDRYNKTVADMEQIIKGSDSKLAQKEHEKDALSATIRDLEHKCAELTGRRRERDDAYRDLQAKLDEQANANEALRIELALRSREIREALDKATKQEELITSLERGVTNRDEAITELETSLSQQRTSNDQRIGELESLLANSESEALSLHDKIAVQQDLIAPLEADRHAYQEVLNVLSQSEQRLNELSMSLHQLDSEIGHATEYVGADRSTVADENGEDLGLGLLQDDIRIHSGIEQMANGLSNAPRPGLRRMIVSLDGDTGYPLAKYDTTIGRSSNSDIRIPSAFVSRIHAHLLSDESGTIIEDSDSKNGILVNSEPANRRLLHSGDIVSLGSELHLKYVEFDGIDAN